MNDLYFQLLFHALDVVLHASISYFTAHFQHHLSFGFGQFSQCLGT
jgi:hypothetical protein